jgi:hypothetical protein
MTSIKKSTVEEMSNKLSSVIYVCRCIIHQEIVHGKIMFSLLRLCIYCEYADLLYYMDSKIHE